MVPEQERIHILELQRFAIHDGPGIRTLVFFQGCPLRCPWCSNPESQEQRPQLRHFRSKCTGCGNCAGACPQKAARLEAGFPVFDRERCTGCGICARHCPSDALCVSGHTASVQETLATVLRDKDYYDASGGGITVSGGEPFAQAAGLTRLLEQSKSEGLHTAVETTAQVSLRDLEAAEPFIDCFLLDIKSADPVKLRETTGADAEQIRETAAWLGGRCPEKITARTPVIPGFNHDRASIQAIFSFALENKIRILELLPYHTLGKDKYRQLGRDYPWPENVMLDSRELVPYAELGRGMGLSITIR